MKKLIVLGGVGLALATLNTAAQTVDELAYVPVPPCRLVDTRQSTGGPLPPDNPATNFDARPFLASGDALALSVQGGSPSGCLHPKAADGIEPAAIAAYVIAVPTSGSAAGVLSVFPSDQPDPAVGTGSTLNFGAKQTIGNTTIITLCQDSSTVTCPPAGPFSVLARGTAQDVVIDVQGYFYPPSIVGEYYLFYSGTYLESVGATAFVGLYTGLPQLVTLNADGTASFDSSQELEDYLNTSTGNLTSLPPTPYPAQPATWSLKDSVVTFDLGGGTTIDFYASKDRSLLYAVEVDPQPPRGNPTYADHSYGLMLKVK